MNVAIATSQIVDMAAFYYYNLFYSKNPESCLEYAAYCIEFIVLYFRHSQSFLLMPAAALGWYVVVIGLKVTRPYL